MLKVVILVLLVGCIYADDVDHSLHCHHGADDSIHLHKGESQTLKGTCILLTCVDPDTNLMTETKCPEKPSGSASVIPGKVDAPYPECCDKYEA